VGVAVEDAVARYRSGASAKLDRRFDCGHRARRRIEVHAIYGAGFAEELFFRGYLFERLAKLWGKGAAATLATIILTTALFAAAHWQQGWFGIVNAGITGLALAIVYLICGRKLWVPMVMHAAFDLTAAAMIYFDAETTVSHLVFK
jgi:membrane protease YdiL (CAAX protease family)